MRIKCSIAYILYFMLSEITKATILHTYVFVKAGWTLHTYTMVTSEGNQPMTNIMKAGQPLFSRHLLNPDSGCGVSWGQLKSLLRLCLEIEYFRYQRKREKINLCLL